MIDRSKPAPRRGGLVDRLVPVQRVRTIGWLAVGCAALDSLATWTWLRLGVAVEGNPAVDRVIEQVGLTASMAARTAYVAVLVGLLVVLAEHRPSRNLRAFTGVVATAMVGVVAYHLFGFVAIALLEPAALGR